MRPELEKILEQLFSDSEKEGATPQELLRMTAEINAVAYEVMAQQAAERELDKWGMS